MLFTISKLNRIVELNDSIVKEYCKYAQLREQPFSIVVKTKFGHKPSVDEVSDDDLSVLCNELLLSELKALALLPKALIAIENNPDTITEHDCFEIELDNL